MKFIASQTSLGRAKTLLDQIDLRVMLPAGFERAPSLEASATLSRRPGVQEVRVYGHADEAPIEVAIVNGTKGYDIALSRSSKLGSITTKISALVRSTTQAASRAPVDKGYEMMRLGHIEADRALALLKALGLNTIEFKTK